MEIEDAFDQIAMRLQAASGRGVKPSTRVSGDDWVCSIDESGDKFVIIAKANELLLVSLRPTMGEPEIDRIVADGYKQQDVIERIRQAVAAAYGAPVQ